MTIAIIGAGAAGIGAGLALKRLGRDFIILEAKDRAGGRAFTDEASLGHGWDHGCHWFHTASRNPLRRVALKLGHDFDDQPLPYAETVFTGGAWRGMADIDVTAEAALARVIAAGRRGEDVAAAQFLDRAHPHFPLIRQGVTLSYSQEPEDVSTVDAANFDDSHENTPVRAGYGALVARLAAELPIRLNTAVSAIAVTAKGVSITTAAGALEAEAVILAVPSSVVGGGRIAFTPALPAEIAEAFAALPMGNFEKAAFAFDGDVFGSVPALCDIFEPALAETYPVAWQIQPFGRPIAVAHIAGRTARDLAAAGDGALVDFARQSLASAFGQDVTARITRTAVTGWARDPYIGGAYSCARPGSGHMRARLSRPVHDRIFICGEHASAHSMATAHGAYLTGLEAAHRAAGAAMADIDPLWLPA